ncbi:UNVERIFIED_CONTAM: hypothetical protein PYX00_000520 [Menopon gallinae]|uniref:E3 ubiquitin-protein ligase Topors n=1 Tax=Menopon gallinae TaxID=328185 RepID=A0AAW2I9I2_9NEOP
MEDECPPTPLHVRPGRNSKSPNQLTVSSPDSDGMKSPNGRLSPDSRCAICLGKLQKKSFTDSCLHQFCFQCLLQWSKVKPECPLCKQPFKSIIYNVRSNFDYDQYHIERREPAYVVSEILHSYDFDLVVPLDSRFRYRSSMTREYFTELAESFLTRTRSSYQVPNFVPTTTYHIPPATRYRPAPERRRAMGSSDFRRSIYAQDLWVQDLVDVSGRYRECSPQFYRENPAQIHRIIPWLNREINSLLIENDSYNAYVLDRIISLLPQYSIRSRQFREVVEPYFGNRTDHFIHEFYTFARSVYDISGFDQHAVYVRNRNYSTEIQEISSSNDDSDVEVIGTLQQKSAAKPRRSSRKSSRNRHDFNYSEPVPGPSGINNPRLTETIEVCESDTDDIKVIDYVKPKPEVVTLSSGDEAPPARYTRDPDHSPAETRSGKHKKALNKRGRKRKSMDDGPKGKKKNLGSRSWSSSSSATRDGGSSFRSRSSSCSSRSSSSSSTTTAFSSSSLSSTSVRGGTSSSDYVPIVEFKKKKTSKGHHKKNKKSDVKKIKRKDSKSLKRKSKVKSCVVVPSSSGKYPRKDSKDGSVPYPRKADHSYSGTDDETQSSLPSYWSLAFSDKR